MEMLAHITKTSALRSTQGSVKCIRAFRFPFTKPGEEKIIAATVNLPDSQFPDPSDEDSDFDFPV
jgi:hypothetical protein